MNEELKKLLEEAYNRGASKSDLDAIIAKYNSVKKKESGSVPSTSSNVVSQSQSKKNNLVSPIETQKVNASDVFAGDNTIKDITGQQSNINAKLGYEVNKNNFISGNATETDINKVLATEPLLYENIASKRLPNFDKNFLKTGEGVRALSTINKVVNDGYGDFTKEDLDVVKASNPVLYNDVLGNSGAIATGNIDEDYKALKASRLKNVEKQYNVYAAQKDLQIKDKLIEIAKLANKDINDLDIGSLDTPEQVLKAKDRLAEIENKFNISQDIAEREIDKKESFPSWHKGSIKENKAKFFALKNQAEDLLNNKLDILFSKGQGEISDSWVRENSAKISSYASMLRLEMFKDRIPLGNNNDEKSQYSADNIFYDLGKGLEVLKYKNPSAYKNAVRTFNEQGKIGNIEEVLKAGQQVNNLSYLKQSFSNPDFIDKQSGLNYNGKTDQKREQIASNAIGEVLADKQGKNKRSMAGEALNIMTGGLLDTRMNYSEDEIESAIPAARKKLIDLGYSVQDANDILDKQIIENLKWKEQVVGFDAIPKKATVISSFLKGVQQPFIGVRNTINGLNKSASDSYMESIDPTSLSNSGTKVAYKDGGEGFALERDKDNFAFKAVEGLGAFFSQIALTRLTGIPLGTERLRNITGTLNSTFLQTYDDSYKEAIQKTGDPSKAGVIATFNSAIQAVTELVQMDTNVGNKIMGIFNKGGYADDIAKLSINTVGELREKATPIIKKFVKETLNTNVNELGEEVLSNWGNYLIYAIAEPRANEGRHMINETLQIAKETSISMAIPSLLGGGSKAMSKDFIESSLHAAALDPSLNGRLEDLKQDGKLSEQQYNDILKVTNTHKESIAAAPTVDINDNKLSIQDRAEFAYQQTLIKINEAKALAEKNTVLKEGYERKIKESEEIQRSIYDRKVETKPTNDVVENSNTIIPTGKRIFTDFDETLWDNKQQKLTPLGEELKAKIASGEIKQEDVEVITKRENTRENRQFIADKIGLNPLDVSAGLNAENKAAIVDGFKGDKIYYNDNQQELDAAKTGEKVNVNKNAASENAAPNQKITEQEESRNTKVVNNIEIPNVSVGNIDALIEENKEKIPELEKLLGKKSKGAKAVAVEAANKIINEYNAKLPKVDEEVSSSTEFIAKESQFDALKRLTTGIENLPEKEQKAEIERRAKEHDASYQSFLTGNNSLTDENKGVKRVADFGGMTAKAMSEFLVNPKKYADNKGAFENGSRIDENGNVIAENDFVTLKEKVKELNKNKEANKEEVAKINAAPKAYLESLKGNAGMEGRIIKTDKATMWGSYGYEAKVANKKVTFSKPGYYISDVVLNKGEEKGKGSGQEIYIKALKENGRLYSTSDVFQISDDAMRVQNALLEKGLVTIRNEKIDGINFRVIEPTQKLEQPKEGSGGVVLSKDEKKSLKEFLLFVETRQSESKYQNMNIEGFKTAYNNLPKSVKDFIGSNLQGKIRAYEGELSDSETPSFSNQFIPQLFGKSKVRGEQVDSNSGTIDTKKLVELADNNNIKHNVGDSEGEVIVISPKFKKGAESNRGALYDYTQALVEMDTLLGDSNELNKEIRKEKRRLDELLDDRKFYNDLANSDNVFDVLKKYGINQKYFKRSLKETTKEETPTPKGNTSNVGGEDGLTEGANKILGLHDNGVSFDLFDNNKLREIAKENGIDLPEGAKNADIIEALKNKRNEATAKGLENLSEKDFDKLTPSQKVVLYKEHGITKEDGSPITEKDIENSPLQYSYDFMAYSDSGKWNSANSELESAVQGNRKQYSLYKLMNGEFDTFKEFVDFINSKNYGDKIEYTDRMKRADDMSPEERKAAVDSYNKSVEDKVGDKSQKEKDILDEHGLKDETEYSPHELVEKFPLKGVQKVIWDIISPIVKKLGIKVKFSSSRITEGFDGSSNPMNGEVLLRPSTLKNGRLGEVLVHEVVHSLTTKIISRVNSGVETGLTSKQVAAVKGLGKLYKSIEADNNLQNKYPVKDIFEFIAHLTNDTFVKELQSKDRNFIQKVVDFISDILGLSDANELAKKYLKDIIHDGTFLEKEGITVVSSDYAANVKGAEGLTPKQRLLEAIKNNSKTTAEKYHDLKSKGKENDFTKAVEQSLKETTKEGSNTNVSESVNNLLPNVPNSFSKSAIEQQVKENDEKGLEQSLAEIANQTRNTKSERETTIRTYGKEFVDFANKYYDENNLQEKYPNNGDANFGAKIDENGKEITPKNNENENKNNQEGEAIAAIEIEAKDAEDNQDPEKANAVIEKVNAEIEKLTLSGLTEEERKRKVEKRRKQTDISNKQKEVNALHEKVKSYKGLPNGRFGKTKDAGLQLLNYIRVEANRIGLKFDAGYEALYKKDVTPSRRNYVKPNNKDIGNLSLAKDEDTALLNQRSSEVQDLFKQLYSTDTATGLEVGNPQYSNAQIGNALEDIADGIPSIQAKEILDVLEKSIEDGFVPFKNNGERVAITLEEVNAVGDNQDKEDIIDVAKMEGGWKASEDGADEFFEPNTKQLSIFDKESQTKNTENGISFISSTDNGTYPKSDNLQPSGSSNNRIISTVIGVWNKVKNIQFTGTTKVKNAADVAHIMQLLENKSVEHAFAVHIDKKGKSHIQYLSIGGLTGTVVDPRLILSGVKKFDSKKVYLVHNHPSGNLTPSNADLEITKKIRYGLYGIGVSVEHIIMDTYKKQYVHINVEGDYSVESRNLEDKSKVKLETFILDEQKIIGKPMGKVNSSKDAANFIQQLRFTAMPKNAVLILNQSNEIIGNYVFQDGIEDDALLSFISNSAIATSVIFYGNQNNIDKVNAIAPALAKFDIRILDHVVTGSNTESVSDYYESMADKGLLGEQQKEYGTNEVNEPIKDQTPEQQKAIQEIQRATKEYDKKRKELYGKLQQDQTDLFGNRPSVNTNGNLFGSELDNVSNAALQKALEPFKAAVDKARQQLDKANKEAKSSSQGSLFQKGQSKFKTISRKAYDALLKQLKKAFPNVEVRFFNDGNVNEVLGDTNGLREFKTPEGKIYGFKKDGKVYLNENEINSDSPIHEFSHIWEEMLPNTFRQGVELLKATKQGRDLIAKIRDNKGYKNLTDTEVEREALNTAIGNKGEGIFTGNALTKFKEWLKMFFKRIGAKLGIRELTPDDKFEMFVRDAVKDLLGGKEIVAESDGNMFVIDPVISLDTEDRGYGGTRETALPDMDYTEDPKFSIDGTTDLNDKDKEILDAFVEDIKDGTYSTIDDANADYKDISGKPMSDEAKKYITDKLGNNGNTPPPNTPNDTSNAADDDFAERVSKIGNNDESRVYQSILHRDDEGKKIDTKVAEENEKLRIAIHANDAAILIQDYKSKYRGNYLNRLLNDIKSLSENRKLEEKLLSVSIHLENEINGIREGFVKNEYDISPQELTRINRSVQNINKRVQAKGSNILTLSKMLYNWYNLQDTYSKNIMTEQQSKEFDAINDVLENDEEMDKAAEMHENGKDAVVDAVNESPKPKPTKTKKVKSEKTKADIDNELMNLKKDIENLNC